MFLLVTFPQAIPLGVPRFKKLPQDPKYAGYSKGTTYGGNQIPQFQKLPPFVPKNFNVALDSEAQASDSLPRVDLKGHSIEELAAMANVSVETIKAAMKLRQQQLAREKTPITQPATTLLTPITKHITPATSTSISISTSTTPIVRTEQATEVVVVTANTPAPEITKKSSPAIKFKKPHHKMTSNASYRVMVAMAFFDFLMHASQYLFLVNR
jgi:hypothetical protein